MIDSKNRYGRTAARIHDADGLARRPSSPTIDIHAHIVVPQATAVAQPHVDMSRIPLATFADAPTKEVNARQEKDVREVMTTLDKRLDKLEAANGSGTPVYVLKWSDETDEQALEREAKKGRELDREHVVFVVWER